MFCKSEKQFKKLSKNSVKGTVGVISSDPPGPDGNVISIFIVLKTDYFRMWFLNKIDLGISTGGKRESSIANFGCIPLTVPLN